MPEHNPGVMGGKLIYSFYKRKRKRKYFIGTMRLGRRTTHFVTDDSILSMYIFSR